MLLSGFTFIRNARKFDFPIVECVESMLPIVDELVINVGKSEDGTEEFLAAALKSPKIRFIHSVWDDSKTAKGLILSEQTNIALDACRGRWALYLQADEALHEAEHAVVRKAVDEEEAAASPVDGLRFRYLHFYGGYSLVQRPWNWYPSEVRIVRRDAGVRSFGDAQSFWIPQAGGSEEGTSAAASGGTLRTRLLDAHVFHYGHARAPEVMGQKIHYFHRFWHGDNHGIKTSQVYALQPRKLVWYWGSHPAPYRARLAAGASWSPTPASVAGPLPTTLLIRSSSRPEDENLAKELESLVSTLPEPRPTVLVARSWWAWLRILFTRLFPRKQATLIDLGAESRSLPAFLAWAPDILAAFSRRIAHAPAGRLGRFREKFYTSISWGGHENRDQGFKVPGTEYARQLLRWAGFTFPDYK